MIEAWCSLSRRSARQHLSIRNRQRPRSQPSTAHRLPRAPAASVRPETAAQLALGLEVRSSHSTNGCNCRAGVRGSPFHEHPRERRLCRRLPGRAQAVRWWIRLSCGGHNDARTRDGPHLALGDPSQPCPGVAAALASVGGPRGWHGLWLGCRRRRRRQRRRLPRPAGGQSLPVHPRHNRPLSWQPHRTLSSLGLDLRGGPLRPRRWWRGQHCRRSEWRRPRRHWGGRRCPRAGVSVLW